MNISEETNHLRNSPRKTVSYYKMIDGAAFSLHPQFMHFELYKIRKENQYFKKVNCYYKCPVAKQVSKKLTVGCKIARQQAACQEFDQKMGWDIVGEIERAGVTSLEVSQYTGKRLL